MKTTKNCLFCSKSFEGGPLALYCSTSHRVLGNRKQKGLSPPIWSGGSSNSEVASLRARIDELLEDNRRLDQELGRFRTENEELTARLLVVETVEVAVLPAQPKPAKAPRRPSYESSFDTMFKQARMSSEGVDGDLPV